MVYRFCLFALLFLVATATSVRGEKANMSPDALRKTATHVIVGKVVGVYERTETIGDWKYTHYVAEVRLQNVEKGDGVAADDLVYARYWKRRWVGEGRIPPSTSGHRGLPKKEETLRIYLARNAYDGFTRDNHDGGFNVIGANGFERLKPASNK